MQALTSVAQLFQVASALRQVLQAVEVTRPSLVLLTSQSPALTQVLARQLKRSLNCCCPSGEVWL